jgi:heme exporter protein D
MNSWTSLAEFLAMGGHAVFVWGSLGMCAAVMALEVLWLRARRRALAAPELAP